ncbi:signal peptidase I [Eubacteriales bacterium OttesenSCG-928-N14]|nr:signal peptidase I [Eubacteriales bacterium OttesenSCG-928-N14]
MTQHHDTPPEHNPDESTIEQPQQAGDAQDTAPRYSNPSRAEDNSKRRERHWMLRTLIITFALAILLRLFIIQSVRVDGPSMQPTLYTNELVLVEKISYRFTSPKRQQVVVFEHENFDHLLIKRVIGIEGDEVCVIDGYVYINGERIEDPHAAEPSIRDTLPVIVPQGHVFVMGDNRNNSQDSRSFGPIPHSSIVGQGLFIIWPISSWGGV